MSREGASKYLHYSFLVKLQQLRAKINNRKHNVFSFHNIKQALTTVRLVSLCFSLLWISVIVKMDIIKYLVLLLELVSIFDTDFWACR